MPVQSKYVPLGTLTDGAPTTGLMLGARCMSVIKLSDTIAVAELVDEDNDSVRAVAFKDAMVTLLRLEPGKTTVRSTCKHLPFAQTALIDCVTTC